MKLILKTILLLCAIIIVVRHLKSTHLRSPTELYNAVELHARYKNCIVIDKYTKNDKYYFILYNPYTTNNQISKVEVNDYMYYNIYFIKDTIK